MKKKIKPQKIVKLLPGNLPQRILSTGSGSHSGLSYIAFEIPHKDNPEVWTAILSFALKTYLFKNHYNKIFLTDLHTLNDFSMVEFRYSRSKNEKKLIKNVQIYDWDKHFNKM